MRIPQFLTCATVAIAFGCSSDAGGPVALPVALAPLAPFASDTLLVVSSEDTSESLAVLALDTATGEVGLLPDSPASLGVTVGDAETLAADPARRRVFFGSNKGDGIAVVDLDGAGRPVPVTGSPFASESTGVSVIQAAPTGDLIYVGYHATNLLSRYSVSAGGSLTLEQSITTDTNGHVETMLLVDDVLYVGFESSSRIVGYRLDGTGAFAAGPQVVADVLTNARPDYLRRIGDKLYCSLAADGSVDAFAIEADGSLTRLAGAPYAYPGIGAFELIAVQPGGARIAVGAETPSAAIGVYLVNPDGSLAPAGEPLILHERKGGPEGMAFSADGRFLFVCDHVGIGLYVLELSGDLLEFSPTPRYRLPGRQIDILRLDLPAIP